MQQIEAFYAYQSRGEKELFLHINSVPQLIMFVLLFSFHVHLSRRFLWPLLNLSNSLLYTSLNGDVRASPVAYTQARFSNVLFQNLCASFAFILFDCRYEYIVACMLVTRQYIMDSGLDNSIYWIISHVVTTIRYYTFEIAASMTHKHL
jgi:hypothetical protein